MFVIPRLMICLMGSNHLQTDHQRQFFFEAAKTRVARPKPLNIRKLELQALILNLRLASNI